MKIRIRAAIAAGLLLVLSCGGSSAYADRRRGSRPTPPQTNHEWARGAVFYEIFVRSFADSDGDGIGDFNGLISRLDYLNDGNPATTTDLNIDGIWLMPMFESTSYHGYDTVDYQNVERDYGTNADFQRFLDEAHRRGIRVILDFVMNHTGNEHPWFIESASSSSAAKRDWYIWSSADPGWRQPWGGNDPSWHFRNGAFYYGAFWSGMPDLNFRNPEVKAEMFRLGRYWLTLGADGYRLDATRYLVETGAGESGQADTAETHGVLREFTADMRSVKPDVLLIAENTVDTRKLASYFGSIPMNFNFPLATAIVEGVRVGDANRIRDTLRDVIRQYPAGIIDTPFLTNHDQTRIATVLMNDAGKLRNAAAILLTLPGTPFIYYGEEVGMQNGPASNDEAKRTPMPWTPTGGFSTALPWHAYAPGIGQDNVATQANDPSSLLSYYRNWIAARKRSPALLKGDITVIDAQNPVLAYIRTTDGERVLVLHNLSNITTRATGLPSGNFEPIHLDVGVASPTEPLPPHSSGVWRHKAEMKN